jgi:hypothetical protein
MTTGATVTDSRGEQHRVGVSQAPISSGALIHRSKTTRGGAAPRFATLLTGLGYDMTGKDADHVRDLAFGGHDAYNNLWPLDRNINQRASTMGQWYSTYRLQYIDRTGAKPEQKEKPITSLRGKTFKVIGTTYNPAPNPGGRDSS